MTERILKTCLAAALLFLLAAAPSFAGRYHVYSCRMPDGEVAPTDGWSGALAPGGAFDDYVKNLCASGGELVAALGNETSHLAFTDRATWSFTTPNSASLVGATLTRAGYVHGKPEEPASYEFWLAGPTLQNIVEECVYAQSCRTRGDTGEGASAVNRITVPAKHLGEHLYLSAACGGGLEGSECAEGLADPNNYAAALYLYAADLTLEQTSGPTVSSVGGELASAAAVSGTSDLTFSASDPGSGVYEIVFTVDGTAVQTVVPDEADGSCRNVGQTTDGLPAFLHLQPCPASVSAAVAFDASGIPPGSHHLVVSVLDGAGNSAPLLDRTISVSAPPGTPPSSSPGLSGSALPGSPNGAGATAAAVLKAHWQSTTRSRLVVPYGRTETILGKLTDPGGVPIAGAQIAVSSTAAVAGASAAQMKGAVTSANGSFALRLPARLSSRTIALAYTAHLGEPRPVAASALQLAVQAPVSMTIRPRLVASRGTISFRGRLLSGPYPKGGKPIVLEARSGRGAWIEFHVARANQHGRFTARYRFKYPGPARYEFRAVCEQEADYPFATGATRGIAVTER